MTRRSMLLFTTATLLIGCGGKKDDDGASTKDPAKEPVVEKEAAHELVASQRKTVVSRAGALEISIDLPDEAKPPRVGTDNAVIEFKNTAMQLTITASASPLRMEDLQTRRKVPAGEEVLRADETSGGYVFTKANKDKSWFAFEHCRSIPSGSVCCAASLRTKEPIATLDNVILFVTDVCQHLTVNGEPHQPPATVNSKTKG